MLFLKMSSVQEDADMFSMRCKLLEAEANRESARTRSFKVLQCPSHSRDLILLTALPPHNASQLSSPQYP